MSWKDYVCVFKSKNFVVGDKQLSKKLLKN